MVGRQPPDPFVTTVGHRLADLLQSVPATRLCVALSGGPDSVALLAALAALPAPLPLRALHVNHHLQAQADDWMRGCRRLARSLGVPLSVRHVAVPVGRGLSPEAAAREVRRAAFLAALRPGEALLTAHHLDDQFETLLLMLMRGSGVHGLAAMPAAQRLGRGWLLRPLLDEPRAALAAFVARRGLPHVLDESNADERFDRNFLRRRVTPLLGARWPGAARTVARTFDTGASDVSAFHASAAVRSKYSPIQARRSRYDTDAACEPPSGVPSNDGPGVGDLFTEVAISRIPAGRRFRGP